jgi:hypothetical protein
VVRYIPELMARVQHRQSRQILVSTHSSELLGDEGIGPNEVLLFTPTPNGTVVQSGAAITEIRQLLESGLTVADAVMPRTQPERADRLTSLLE